MAVSDHLAAVVLAAGYSRRMEAFKPLLPLGATTVVERVLATVREAGVETIRVVVGWNAALLIPVLERCGAPWTRNERFAEGMYTSIQVGLRSLPTDVAAFFLLPADMPLVQSATLAQLAAEWDAQPKGIVYPCHHGKRGHPPLIAAGYISEILAAEPAGGLREVLGERSSEARLVECADPGVLIDLDTPDEYRRSLARTIPS